DEFGFPSDRDFKGRATSKGASIFAARALSRTVAVGVEAGFASASFYKSPSDASTLAGRVHESGLSDLQVEVDYSFLGESRLRPAAFLVTEIALPHNTNKPLIGSPGVVVRPALGAFKHFGNTIVLARLAGEYDSDSGTALDWGEWGVEAGARIGGSFRITAGFEGTVGGSNNFDEVSLVTDARWTSRRGLGIRAQNSVGFTTNNKGYSPEVGIVFQF
ncbi:MAG: hypothetical protein ABIS03_14430, partial [Gemmatimonadaceae bacterium]